MRIALMLISVALVLSLGCNKEPPVQTDEQAANLSGTYRGVFLPEADNELMRLELQQVGLRINGVLLYYGEKRDTGWKEPPETMKISGVISDGILWLAIGPKPDFGVMKLKPNAKRCYSGEVLDAGRPSDLDLDNNQRYDGDEFVKFFELKKATGTLARMEFEKE